MPDLIKMAGAVRSAFDIRDYRGRTDLKEEDMPSRFSLDVSALPVELQAYGTCVSHSLVKGVEYFNLRETGQYKKFSVGFVNGNRENPNDTTEGLCMRSTLKRLQKYGAVPFEHYPYEREAKIEVPAVLGALDELAPLAEPHRIFEFYRARTRKEIKAALLSGHWVSIVVEWGENVHTEQDIFCLIQTGVSKSYLILDPPFDSRHAMFIYGWDEEGWLIRNSYGTMWGDYGTALLPYEAPIDEAWGIVDFNNNAEQAIRIEHPNIPKVVAKIANKFFDLFYRSK